MKLSKHLEFVESLNELIISVDQQKKHIRLEHQLGQILLLLFDKRGELVEKEVFIEKIWEGNLLIGQKALTKNIFKLRKLLKQYNLEGDLIIETIPKKGYSLNILKPPKINTINRKTLLLAATISGLLISTVCFFTKRQVPSDHYKVVTIGKDQKDTIILLGNRGTPLMAFDTTTNEVFILE